MKKIIAILLLLVSVPAQADEVSDGERFQLWNDCEPIGLLVSEALPDFPGFETDMKTLAESRLRAARIYNADGYEDRSSFLYVGLYFSDGSNFLSSGDHLWRAYSVDIDFYQYVQRGDLNTSSITWKNGLVGEFDLGPFGLASISNGTILQHLSELMDGFINEYLRVNEAAC